ncbi:c-type cytochrome [Marilutibacter alkalisoli]|uniref:C-type cytochrome n=1 Tax=Marilutibacter alkalisoli TaxID=2591633 RepID=A0A514BRN9_9GAMM|nr:c-type cytochrome [Lysobacter alkalisoli]QDH70068.1 c-type cytochrome [Lysobacter alkalisoli]
MKPAQAGAVLLLSACAGLGQAGEGAPVRGEPARGERVFQQCYACHSVQPGEDGLPGPNLAGVVGRGAGRADFDYSPALRAAAIGGLVWTREELDAFLRDPEARLPGNTMGYVGLRDRQMRADVIAWLAAHTDTP